MSFTEAVLLGIVQGLTEFLPVSSSGHLVLAKALLGIEEKGIAFEIFVHFGTLLAVITIYKSDLRQIIVDCFSLLSSKLKISAPPEEITKPDGARMFLFVLLGTIPTAILGLLFRGVFEETFSDVTFVAGALIFTGLILISTRFVKPGEGFLTGRKAFLIGLAQVIAFFPGVSRSGTTIAAGLFQNVKPAEAAKYSFFLAIPLIAGVTIIKSVELILAPPPGEQIIYFAVGCTAAYFSGLWAIKWLVAVVQHGRFSQFAYYCFAAGGLGLAARFVG